MKNQRKPDLPLRTLIWILKTTMHSPVGQAVLRFGRAIFPPDQKDWVEVTSVRLKLPRLNPAFHGFRVVQISDFHIGTWIDRRHLEEAVDLVNAQQPDLVAMTGDFVTFHPERYAATLIGTLKKLSPRVATLAILGNHDHWTDPDLIRSVIKEAGAIDLSNRVFTVSREGAKLHFAGVDDYMDNRDRLDLVLKALPKDREAAVLLAHEPDFADLAAKTGRFDLQISGHSHGGQIRVPLIGAPFLPRFARKYPSGLYRVKGLILYTNRGLGTAEFNVRWNCRPEITVFTLASPKCSDPNEEQDSF